MAVRRVQGFFGDDWEDTLDSVLSVPGAFGNIVVAAVRQVKVWDVAAVVLVGAGLAWLAGGFLLAGDRSLLPLGLSVVPLVLWLTCGAIGGLVFEIGGIGKRALAFWESYLLIALFAAFGTVSLRIALNPKDRLVFRAPSAAPVPPAAKS